MNPLTIIKDAITGVEIIRELTDEEMKSFHFAEQEPIENESGE